MRADTVSLDRGGRPVLHEVSLTLRPGAVTVVVGPNGAGKSSLLKVMTGELKPKAGAVTLDGMPVHAMASHALARRRAVMSQTSRLVFPFTALEVVRLGVESVGSASRRRANEIAFQALASVGMERLAGRRYLELSGGEARRVDLARALCQIHEASTGQPDKPCFLLLDEPTANLDPEHQVHCLEIAREAADRGLGVLAILHDLNLGALLADEIVAMKAGRVVAAGPPKAVMTREILSGLFDIDLAPNAVPEGDIPFVLPHSAWLARRALVQEASRASAGR